MPDSDIGIDNSDRTFHTKRIAASCGNPFLRGDGGIRTLVPRRANAFRVRPVMTASIRLHWAADFCRLNYYKVFRQTSQLLSIFFKYYIMKKVHGEKLFL